jgi:Immunoglobulin V-set domain
MLFAVMASGYQEKTASVGQQVVLPCHTTLSASVDWRYMNTSISKQLMYSGFTVYDMYENKISNEGVDQARGYYNLTIHNVQVSDSGLYVCTEDNGDEHAVLLIVSG